MAFSEFEEKRLAKVIGSFIEKRQPLVHLREQLDLNLLLNDSLLSCDSGALRPYERAYG